MLGRDRQQIEAKNTGDAAVRDGGIASSGAMLAGQDIVGGDKHEYYYGERHLQQTWPTRIGVVPRQARAFQKRREEEALRAALAGGGTGVACRVLSGTGGVGKSQLAAHYAETIYRAGQVDLLLWVSAVSPDAVVAGYARAAAQVLGVDGDEGAAEKFLAWLADPRTGDGHRRWLVVLDDVVDPSEMGQRHLWPPECEYGSTVVTSRRRDTAALPGEIIPLGVFTPDQSVAYLDGVLGPSHPRDAVGAREALAGDLGHLPLALAQAAAYIKEEDVLIDDRDCNHCGCRCYRRLLVNRTHGLGDLKPESLPDDQERSVAATWSLSIELAARLDRTGLVRPLLQLVSLLDANGIPDTVLTSDPAVSYCNGNDESAVAEVDAALRILHRLSLIDHDRHTPHQAVRIHQLTQRAVRETFTHELHRRAARAVGDALLQAWPEIENETVLAQALRANVTALVAETADSLIAPEVHPVLYRAGRSLGEAGQATAATAHFDKLLHTTTRVLGTEHPHTLTTRHNLAAWRGETGDSAGAVAAYRELLPDAERVLGEEHPTTLSARGSLAWWRGMAGDAAGAVEAFAELLPVKERVLGPEHMDTLTACGNLAWWRGMAGDAAGAVEAFAELLPVKERVLGPEHPQTLTTRHCVAHWRGVGGDAVGAADGYAALLPVRVRVLGEEHPATLAARHSLAWWRGAAGDVAGAVEAFAELLRARECVLGEEHTDTLATRHCLAHWREMASGQHMLSAEHTEDQVAGPSLAWWQGDGSGTYAWS